MLYMSLMKKENRDFPRLFPPHSMSYIPLLIKENRYDIRFHTTESPVHDP